MQVTVNLNDEQLDRLNSVMQQYNITHEEAILMLIGTQPKESELQAARMQIKDSECNCRFCIVKPSRFERARHLKRYMEDKHQL